MEQLGRYQITGEVGRGGMGVVYRAVDSAIGRTVAIKVVRLSEYASPQEVRSLRDRLLREAQAAGALSHPNIVAVHDLGQEGDTAYIVMEFVQGRTLDQVLADSGAPRPQEWYLKVLAEVAQALDHAHSRHIFHRDIKPGNIMVQDDGAVKVTDFGIAKLAWTKTMTETGMIMGSPYYMAPEQLRGEPVTAKTDQFALAGVAYTVLTGRRPFDADTVASLFHKILEQNPVPVQALNPTVNPAVEPVLRKAMAKDPAERFTSCTEFVEALEAAHRAVAQTAPPPPKPHKPRNWLWAAAVVGALALLTLVAFCLLERHQAAQTELAYRDSIKASADRGAFARYLERYPSGRFTDLAQRQLEALRPPEAPAPAPTRPPETQPAKPTPAQPKPTALPAVKPALEKPATPVETVPSKVEEPKPPPTPPPPRQPSPGEVRTNPADGQRYVWVPAGTFQMGCSPGDSQCDGDENPRHAVTISQGFWMGQTEVTVGAYKRFAQATGRGMPPEPELLNRKLDPGWGDDAQPVVNVTWDDAVAYCRWAEGRLPTEAEWEYAARAGTTGPYHGELDAVAWYADNSGKQRIDSAGIWQREASNYLRRLADNENRPHAVGQKQRNGFGLYDMLGNVWEWVADWYSERYYAGSDSRDPRGPPGGEFRVLRGGSWSRLARGTRASNRYRYPPGFRYRGYGFRCVREVIMP